MTETLTTTPASTTHEADIVTYPEYRQATNDDGELQTYRINPDGTEEWILDDDALLAEFGVADRHSKAELAAQSAARQKHAAVVDKVKGPVYRKDRRNELLAKHDLAEQAYLEAIEEHAREQINKSIANGEFAETDVEATRAKMQEVINDHMKRTQYDEQQEVLRSGGWKGRLLGKYAKLSRKQKLAVGVGIGVVGAGAGALLGAAGIATAAVGAGLAGTRFARGYYTRIADMYVERQESNANRTDILLQGEDIDQWLKQIKTAYKGRSARDIERYEKIKKRAIVGAVGAVALGASLGAAAGVAGDKIGNTGDWARQWWSGEESSDIATVDELTVSDDPTTTAAETAPAPHAEPDSYDVSKFTSRTVETDDVIDGANETVLSDEELFAEAIEQHLSQPFMVEAGHGYTHELRQALDGLGVNISPEEAYELHKTLVDQVGHQYISGDVYHMGGDQYQWGIGAPGETTWDPRAIEIIKDYALERDAMLEGFEYTDVVDDTPEVTTDAADSSAAEMDNDEHQRIRPEVIVDENGDIAHSSLHSGADALDTPEIEESPDPDLDNRDSDELYDSGIDDETTVDDTAEAVESDVTDESVEDGAEEPVEVTTDGFDEAMARSQSKLAMQADIHEINRYVDRGDIDAINGNRLLQKTLMYLQMDLQNVYYPGTSEPLMSFNEAVEQWQFNPVPDGSYLPVDRIKPYIHAYELRISS